MVIALAGRRIDADNAETVRFPPDTIDKVKEDLKTLFISLRPKAIVCGGACGADLLALEVAGELGIIRSMIIPFEPEVFKSKSVTDRPGNWGKLFDKLYSDIEMEEKVQVLNYEDKDDVYEKVNKEIINKARNLSKKSDKAIELIAVIVWEGEARDKTDITAHFKELAEEKSFIIYEINTLK